MPGRPPTLVEVRPQRRELWVIGRHTTVEERQGAAGEPARFLGLATAPADHAERMPDDLIALPVGVQAPERSGGESARDPFVRAAAPAVRDG